MTRTLTTQDISWFLDLHDKGQLDLDPPYQRRSVWSPRDQRFFIDTILNNYPAPPIFLHKTLDDGGRATYHVVDGKQRLQTIIRFTEDKVRIPDDFANVKLQKKRWSDVDRATMEVFWNYSLIVEMLPNVDEAKIRNTFDRINRNSRKLTPQEMRHAKYEGWFITFVEAEAEQPEWRDLGVVTTARFKRMADVQFISELCAVVLKGTIQGFDQDALDELYAEYEDLTEVGDFVEGEFVDEVGRLKKGILDLLTWPKLIRSLKSQSHFYSLWAYLHMKRSTGQETQDFAPRYDAFMGLVENALAAPEGATNDVTTETATVPPAAAEYARYTRGASTDWTPRKRRHAALVAGIEGSEPYEDS